MDNSVVFLFLVRVIKYDKKEILLRFESLKLNINQGFNFLVKFI